ncbi:ferrous iron transport protein B [Bacillus kwashiorkori]|uniref:ferrous iron transport protein B n=1 Tax=Bacillus kwashiorkori TaxID=1522318 RepID=UPI00078087C0|nr:ferrous iron transport protein B [Bacillus kwashiorkori]
MTEVALFGNPNTGKTSLFNQLTGSYEYVGNWSGVTVEKKVGLLKDKQVTLIDLPGVYSLNPLSEDEKVVSNFLLYEKFTSILNIVDASQLERNLKLTLQLLEYEKPVTIGLNMIDVAKSRGLHIDINKLMEKLGTKVYPIIARTGKNCHILVDELSKQQDNKKSSFQLNYGDVIEEGIAKFSRALTNRKVNAPIRWLAIQAFDGNQVVVQYLGTILTNELVNDIIRETEEKLMKSGIATNLIERIEIVRLHYIRHILSSSTTHMLTNEQTFSDRLDKIFTHRFIGIPLFFAIMFLMFMVTFNWIGFPLSDVLEGFITGPLTTMIAQGLTSLGVSSFIQSLLLDGIIPGVGGVLVFVPQIFLLFFFISLLEDSGYMTRVALLMDRTMEGIGLNGKAFIPMIIGFGCNVPGIMAARTIEQPKERLITILITPLMSCSARLPIYALFVSTFFVKNQAIVVFSLYILGIVLALSLAKLFSKTILKNEQSIFVIDLPPYRLPHMQTLMRSTWDKGKGFVKKAGTVIFGGAVVIWFLSISGTAGLNVSIDKSFLAAIGGMIAPILSPLGFGTWQAGASLITGFFAKESIVSTMNIIYHTADMDQLHSVIASAFTPLTAYAFLAFVLLYIPCLPTVATIKKETGSYRWMIFTIIYTFLLAYLVGFIIYQVGKFVGIS